LGPVLFGVSVAGPVVAADAPPANDKDIPAAPNTGTVFVRRFRFETSFVCDICKILHTFEQCSTSGSVMLALVPF
jgi:hypothetical protein